MTLQLKRIGQNDGTAGGLQPAEGGGMTPEALAQAVERQLPALGDPVLHVREMAISAVVRLGVEAAPLLWPLLDAPTWGRREIAVVDVLKRLGDPRSLPVLEGWLLRGDAVQRLHAIRGLRWHHGGHEPFVAALDVILRS